MWTGNTILRDANTRFDNCIVRPTWYNQSLFTQNGGIASTRDVIDKIEKSFVGTATTCGGVDNTTGKPNVDGEACDMHDVMILGFDVCDDSANPNRAVLSNLKFECNVGEFIHAVGGGMRLDNIDLHNYIEGGLNDVETGKDISKAEWQIIGMADNGQHEVHVTLSGTAAQNLLVNGDTVLISSIAFSSMPTPQTGRWTVENFPATCSTNCAFDLKGSSWTGPTYAGATWVKGSNAITVYDSTDVAGGQYLCDPSSVTPPPFCTPPAGFALVGTFTTNSNIAQGDKPLVSTMPSTVNWPAKGLVKVDQEILGYRLVDRTDIQIISRGEGGTSPNSHSPGAPVIPSAPAVVSPVAAVARLVPNDMTYPKTSQTIVIVNATASSAMTGAGATVNFLNDPYFPTVGSPSCTDSTGAYLCGYAVLNAAYHTWTAKGPTYTTANTPVLVAPSPPGSTPDGTLTVAVQAHTGHSITLAAPFAFKVQEGMQIVDLKDNHLMNVYVDQTPTLNNQVHLSAGAGTIDNDQVQFSGCGYPGLINKSITPAPWQGNCAATAFLFYGLNANYGASGIACDTLRGHGWRVDFHLNNGQETVCNRLIFDSGSAGGVNPDTGATADPTSVGIWVEGNGGKIELADGKAEARNVFVNNGAAGEEDNVSLSNFNVRTANESSVVFVNTGSTILTALQGSASGAGYADSAETSLALTGNVLQNTRLYFDTPSIFGPQTVFCANNSFATTLCSNTAGHVGGLPVISGAIGGGAAFAGTDGAGRITIGTMPSGLVITLAFSIPWPATPVCFAQNETASTRNPVISASSTTMTFTFAATPPVNDNISYRCTAVGG